MSVRLRLATPETMKFGARVTVSTAPSLALTLKLCPSNFSTVPRTDIGVPSGFCAGGVCANPGGNKPEQRGKQNHDTHRSPSLLHSARFEGAPAGFAQNAG